MQLNRQMNKQLVAGTSVEGIRGVNGFLTQIEEAPPNIRFQ